MKKLKVILPAILTLAVSTSAAVTGTVAWFTANRLQTVSTTGVTVVNPEAGLLLNSATDLANTKVDYNNSTKKYTITHGKVQKESVWNDVYLRDASVDMTGNPDVYAAVLNETDGWNSYQKITTAKYPDKDGKTYNGKAVVYATAYELNFSPSSLDENFNYSLFLDIHNSKVTAADLENSSDPANNTDLNKALRIGFKQGNDWFVWAPFAVADDVLFTAPTTEQENDGKYQATYINGTDKEDGIEPYASTDFLAGDADEASGATVPTEAQATGVIAKGNTENNAGDSYFGYLGILNKLYDADDLEHKPGINVQVYTWFEGTDPNCVNLKFDGALDNISTSLSFVMRRTAKN